MFRLFIRLLQNETGFTATEYGLMVALTLIALETMVTKF